MSTTRYAASAEAILRKVEDADLSASDAKIGALYRDCVDKALDIGMRARAADSAEYMRTDGGRDYEVIRDAVRAQQFARYVFEKVAQRCAIPYHDRDSLITCAYVARGATAALINA